MKMQKSVTFVKKNFKRKRYSRDKKYCNVRDHCFHTGEYRVTAHSLCNLKYSVPEKLPIVFHNGSNYYYHLIIKELGEEFKNKWLVQEKTLKNTHNLYFPIEREIMRIFKNVEESIKNICYILQFIDSARFMAISFSHFVNNLSEGIHKTKCKHEHADKKCETCEIK